MVDTVELGTFLKKKRKEKHLTQQNVADIINITERALSNIENGKSEPELDTVLKLCDLYGISGNEIDIFYQRSSDMDYAMELLYKTQPTPKEKALSSK